jgi:hypothetical protein
MGLPLSWLGDELSLKINKEAERTKALKFELLERSKGSLDLSGAWDDIGDATITEYLSSSVAVSVGRKDIVDFSSILQAVISYRISGYDFIQDKHYYKLGKPTILKTHGIAYVKRLMQLYEQVSDELSRDLEEKGITDATKLSKQQYDIIIEGDKRRNSEKIVSSREAIEIQESLAGGSAKYIARLSGGSQDHEECLFYLVNAICTLEDLMHLHNTEDLIEPKSTIPLAFLIEQNGQLNPQSSDIVDTTKRTLEYIAGQLGGFELFKTTAKLDCLGAFSQDINSFIKQNFL